MSIWTDSTDGICSGYPPEQVLKEIDFNVMRWVGCKWGDRL